MAGAKEPEDAEKGKPLLEAARQSFRLTAHAASAAPSASKPFENA